MQLIGCVDSPFVRRVAVTLHHNGLAFDRGRLLTFGNFDEVLKIHPLGKIPALVLDDGQVLIDSSSILDHFDRVVGGERLGLATGKIGLRGSRRRSATIRSGQRE